LPRKFVQEPASAVDDKDRRIGRGCAELGAACAGAGSTPREELMQRATCTHRLTPLLLTTLGILTLSAASLSAQEKVTTLPAEPPAGAVPIVLPPPLGLDDCIALALERQPALAAARSSLAAAHDS